MPRGRLAYLERRAIEAGLAEDLAYAEIARRLGRPTSTVTREVSRNGGGHLYRAAIADAAARTPAEHRRAHDRSSAPHRGQPPAANPKVAVLTDLIVGSGLPRTAARVLLALYTEESGSMTAAQIAVGLGVSPASVSIAVAYLDVQGLLLRDRDPGTRRERYQLGDDLWHRSWEASRQANAAWAEGAADVARDYPKGSTVRRRFEDAADFFERLSARMGAGFELLLDPAMLEILGSLDRAGCPVTHAQLWASLTPRQRRSSPAAIADAIDHGAAETQPPSS